MRHFMERNDFYTLRGYSRLQNPDLSAAMEDYLEMISRLTEEGEYVRVNHLASLLNVKPPSVSKMMNRLREKGLVEFQPYGIISLTQEGKMQGDYLLYRHDILHRFFCMVNNSEDELELVEKIEHFIDPDTIRNMEQALYQLTRK